MRSKLFLILCLPVALCLPAGLTAQSFQQRGFLETDFFGFPLTAPNDSAHVVGEATFRWDVLYKAAPWLTFSAGVEAQTDTHNQTERTFHLDVQDRGLLRPAFSVRNFEASIHKGYFTLDLGKQFIRWGKADILNPTDRFAPKDYMHVVDNDFLGVLGARATIAAHGTSVDLVWLPRFTPSRIPLIDQRWALIPTGAPPQIENAATVFPGGGEYGARINHIGHGYEISGSFFEGYNHLPLLVPTAASTYSTLYVQRFYPKIRMYGTDAAIPLPWFTIKTEAAWIESRETSVNAPRSDSYILWVAQLERQVHQWIFVAGYAGQTILDYRFPYYFDPERGLTRTFLAKASYNIDAPSSVSIETATRQDGQGTWTTAEYSRGFGMHVRAIAQVTIIAGAKNDFLGQYHQNSFAVLRIRYSF